MNAIKIENLTKRVGKKVIFKDINLEVNEGEIFGLLAMENQGKTALARTIFNYLKPNKGSIFILGMNSVKESKEIKENVSYVPEGFLYQDSIRAGKLIKKTMKFHDTQNTEELEFLYDYFEFNPKIRISEMNQNDRKIFSIINALCIRPRLIVLDEPGKNLSTEQKYKLYDYLRALKEEEKVTVFVLTSSLIEAQSYCDRIAYLYDGEICDMEYLDNKVSNDKIIKIYSYIDNLSPFINIGARIIKNSEEEKVLYFDGNMRELSNIIADIGIDNYSIEDSSLQDKIDADFAKRVETESRPRVDRKRWEKVEVKDVNIKENDEDVHLNDNEDDFTIEVKPKAEFKNTIEPEEIKIPQETIVVDKSEIFEKLEQDKGENVTIENKEIEEEAQK